ncbi:hypothetical protein U737_00575 [Methylomonas sp. LW13]|nr:hypothetical protein CWO84_15970 [Methylomonas sp. Kb3]QBC25519.1 hypothetical protein U737_00575 [Methylomonas sp. LW13]
MPIKPKPFAYVCASCGWRKAVSPRSDALMPGEYYDCCPTCGSNSLSKLELNRLQTLCGGLFGRLLKR